MNDGYTGRILRIDLSSRIWAVEPLNRDWAARYYGARGLGVRYLLAEIPAGADPLGPQNPLILMPGPLTGTLVPATGKLAVITKSPATGTVLDCSVGGSIGNAIKLAGYDGVIFQGQAQNPVYVVVNGPHVQIRDAVGLWGKGSQATEHLLLKEQGNSASVISIGQAGENRVPFACMNSELYRQAGRGGAGAVMGSKNLKALVVKGYQGVKVANMPALLTWVKKYIEQVLPGTRWASEEGTPCLLARCQKGGILPTRNYSSGQFSEYALIGHEATNAARLRKKACSGCPVGCGNFIKVGKVTIEGPEYETLAICGSNCDISNLEAIAEFNWQCDDLGLDTVSTGNVVGLAMDLTEKGIHDFGIKFGDISQYLAMPGLIARRESVGAELAAGARALCKKFNVESMAMEVKGLELPGYEPRGSWGMGLAYATADRGGCHMRGFTVGREALGDLDPFTGEKKPEVTIEKQDHNAIKWSLTICDFWPVSYAEMAELMTLTTGKQVTAEEMQLAGERIYNLSRLFNIREGFRRDMLPPRVFEEALGGSGPAAGRVLPREVFEDMLTKYYQLRKWDENGIPNKEKVLAIGLDLQAIELALS